MQTILSQQTLLLKVGGAVETFDGNIQANGRWNQEEKVYHINYLELLAILYALKALCKDKNSLHVQY